MKYIMSEKAKGCIFCDKPKENKDKENYILHRAKTCFIMLNIYPYNSGHLMIASYKHVPDLQGLEDHELSELMLVTRKSIQILTKAIKPDGFNIGINLGRMVGAGVEDHIHIHVVPRWNGDTNFMPTIGDTKVIPELLDATYEKLKQALKTS
ncbi:MAG: HIT domain-containing protein [Actinomycetota bacterium]